MIVATQDNFHFDPCQGALRLGYDVLLEKPIATRLEQVLETERLARQVGRRVMVCFVLRFAAFYRKVKEILDSGVLGEVVSIQASEGVNPWHQAHSFVRGHWSVVGQSSPMILSKCCHDVDILHWLAGRRCTRIASFGALDFFRSERAPAGVPARCTDGCPVGDLQPLSFQNFPPLLKSAVLNLKQMALLSLLKILAYKIPRYQKQSASHVELAQSLMDCLPLRAAERFVQSQNPPLILKVYRSPLSFPQK